MNVNSELKNAKKVLIELVKFKESLSEKNNSIKNDIELLIEQYSLFYLVCVRLLNNMSILRRYQNGPYFARKYHQKYSKNERKIAEKANLIRKYYILDENDFFIHTRILLDRYAKLSKYFFINENAPSPHSFRKHREFFKNEEIYKKIIKHKLYADYIRNNMDWFDIFLKRIRDENIVHINHNFLRLSGFQDSGEFNIIILPFKKNQKIIHINICDLIRSTIKFSNFFINYMKKSI